MKECPSSKGCPVCKIEKDIEEFAYDRSSPIGRASYCKTCVKEIRLEKEADIRAQGPEAWRAFRMKQRGHSKSSVLKKFGLTLADWDSMFDAQNGLCAICGRPPSNKSLFIDHDHSTGRVRGLLCNQCNSGLGMFKDSAAVLAAAITYLEVSV